MSSADNNNSVLRAPPPFPGLLPRPPSSAPFHQQQHQSRGVYPASSSTATTPLTSSNRRTFQQQQPTTTGASALSSASPPGSPHTPTTTTTQQQINRHHQLIRWWRRVVILVLLTSCCSFALFPKMFAGVDKDSLLELEMSVVTTQRSSSSSQPSHQAAHTRHHLPLKSLALQHRQLLDYELYTPPHEMLHRKATTADAAIRGDTSAAKLPQQQQQKQNGGGKKRAGHQQFPWRKVFIVANLYNNEDLIDDFTASLGAFIRRGILGMGLEGGGPSTPSSTSKQQTQRNNNKNNNNNGRGDDNADDGLYLKPEDVFVSVYSNANTDSTPYMLRDVLASELVSISTDYNNQVPNRRHQQQQHPSDISKRSTINNNIGGKLGFHVVPQGVPFCARQRHGVRASGYSYTEDDSPTAGGRGGGDKYSSEAFDPGNEQAGKPKDLSRIQWLACLRNTAMLPLYIRGVDGLFPSSSSPGSVNDATSATSMGGDGSWINSMNAEYVEWKRKLTSATPPSSSAEGGVSSRRSIVDDGYDAFLEHLYTSTSEPGQQKRNVEEERQHKSNFMKTFIKGDTKGRWWEMMSSHTHYAHHPFNSAESTTSTSMNSTERQKNGEDEEDDDDVLVLFFNDIYFYPWQVSHLITPASTTAVSSTPSGVATNTNKQSANDVGDTVVEEGGHRVGDSGSESGGTVVSLDYGDRFDMTCAMDFYYNLYDTWVVRGVDGQPYSPYPPFARDHHSKALLRSVMGTNGVYNQVKNAAYFFEPDNEELEGISSTSTSSSSGSQIEGRDGKSLFPGRYVDRGQRILESLLTTPSRSFGPPPASSASSTTSTLTGLNLPTVPVRSCWNGVVAIRASMFTRYGLKFRYPTEEEKERCPDSECKYIGEDIIDIQSRNQLRRISNNIMRSHSDDATTPSSSLSKAAIVVHNKRGGGGGMRSLLRPASISINTLVQVSYEAGFFEMFQGEQVQNDVKIRIIPTGDDDDDQRNQNNGGRGGDEYVQWVSMSWYVPPQDPITMSDSRMANSLLHRLSDSRSGGSRHWISGSQIGAGRGGGLIWDWLLSSIHYHLPHTAAGDGIADTDKYDDDRNRNRRCLRSSSNQHHSIASLCISERASPPTLLAATWNTIHFLMSTPIRIVCFVLDWSIVPVLRVLWRILSILGLGGSYDDQWVPAVPSATSGERSTRPLSELLLATLSSSMNIAAWLRHFYSSGFFFDFVSWLSVGEGGGGAGGEVFNTHKGSSSTITNIQQLPKYPLHPIIGANNNNNNNINPDVRCPNHYQKSLTPPLIVSISSSSSSSSSSVISPVLVFNTACQLEQQQSSQGYNDGVVGLDSVISLATSAAVLRHSQDAVKLSSSSYSSDATIQAQLKVWKKDVIQALRVNTAGSDRCGFTTTVVDDMMWKVVVDRLQPPINEAENAQKQQQRRQGKVDDSTTTTTSTSTTALKTLLLRACHRYLGISFNFGIWGRDEETERVAALHRNMIHQMVASRPQPSSTSSSSSTSHHLGSNTMGGININDDLRFMMPLDVFHTPRGSNHHDDWCSVVPCEFVRYQAMSSSSRHPSSSSSSAIPTVVQERSPSSPPVSSSSSATDHRAVCRSSSDDGDDSGSTVAAPVTTFEEATTQLAEAGIRPRDLSPVIFALSSPSAMTCLWVTSTFNVKTSIASMSIWGLLVLFLAPLACATCLSITIRRMACTQRVCGDCGGGSDGCCVGVSASGTMLPSTPLSGCCGCVVPPEGMQRIWSVVRKGIVRKVCPAWVVGRNASLSPVSSSVPPYRSSSGDHTPYAVVIPNSTSPFDDVTAQDSSTTIRPVVVRNINR